MLSLSFAALSPIACLLSAVRSVTKRIATLNRRVGGGAAVELLEGDDGEGWSGDESVGRFALTHDGSAAEIVVVYGTRAD